LDLRFLHNTKELAQKMAFLAKIAYERLIKEGYTTTIKESKSLFLNGF